MTQQDFTHLAGASRHCPRPLFSVDRGKTQPSGHVSSETCMGHVLFSGSASEASRPPGNRIREDSHGSVIIKRSLLLSHCLDPVLKCLKVDPSREEKSRASQLHARLPLLSFQRIQGARVSEFQPRLGSFATGSPFCSQCSPWSRESWQRAALPW